jgi:hypothetical protein
VLDEGLSALDTALMRDAPAAPKEEVGSEAAPA